MNLESYVRASLAELRFNPARARGQNFLIDENIQESLARRARLTARDTVVEVGTGLGTLTRRLAHDAGKVYTFEIESILFGFLDKQFKEIPNVTLLKKSFNSYSLGELLEDLEASWKEQGTKERVKICANLPYQITHMFTHAIVEYQDWIELVCVMIQREVAARLAASPGSKAYGSLSIWLQTYYSVEPICEVPPESFVPPPKVHSTVIALTPVANVEDSLPQSGFFFDLVEGVFRHRRKKIPNAIVRTFSSFTNDQAVDAVKAAGVNPDIRPEDLTREEYFSIAVELEKANPKAVQRKTKHDADSNAFPDVKRQDY